MKRQFLTFKGFISVYIAVMIINFSLPFFLPAGLYGAYLFWALLPLIVIIFVFAVLRGKYHE